MPTPVQNALKGLPELGTEHSVNDRIERRVEVAQPEEEAGHVGVDLARVAQWHEQRHDEEGQPAHDEGAGDDGERLGGLPLALRLQGLLLLLAVHHGILLDHLHRLLDGQLRTAVRPCWLTGTRGQSQDSASGDHRQTRVPGQGAAAGGLFVVERILGVLLADGFPGHGGVLLRSGRAGAGVRVQDGERGGLGGAVLVQRGTPAHAEEAALADDAHAHAHTDGCARWENCCSCRVHCNTLEDDQLSSTTEYAYNCCRNLLILHCQFHEDAFGTCCDFFSIAKSSGTIAYQGILGIQPTLICCCSAVYPHKESA